MQFNTYVENAIPFKEKGRSRDGLDCWGLVRLFYSEQKSIDLPDLLDCYTTTKDKTIPATVTKEATTRWCKINNPICGDVVLCRIAGQPMHVGIYHKGDYMLHIERGNTPVIENIGTSKWKHRIIGYYRLTD